MRIDTLTYQAFQQIQNPILTASTKTISALTEPIILLILSLIIATCIHFCNPKPKTYTTERRRYAYLFSITIIITVAVIQILKEIIKRPRPISTLIQETGFSFPSGHTIMSIVFFGLIVYIFATQKNKTKAIAISTIIISIIIFSRLYLQVHWLTDVIAGIILGSIILTTSILIHKNIFKTSSQKNPSNQKK